LNCIHLYVLYLWLIAHPIVSLTNFWIHGMCIYIYIYIYVSNLHFQHVHLFSSFLTNCHLLYCSPSISIYCAKFRPLYLACQRLDLLVLFCRTIAFKKSVVNTGIKLYLYNKLSNQMRKLERCSFSRGSWDPFYYNIHSNLYMNICIISL
jgi:hypothetical protein